MTIGLRVPSDAGEITGLRKVVVPAQTMKTFETDGPQPKTLIARWSEIWNLPLNRTYVADYDVYDSNAPDRVVVHVGITN